MQRLLLLVICTLSFSAFAQTGSMDDSGAAPASSAPSDKAGDTMSKHGHKSKKSKHKGSKSKKKHKHSSSAPQ